MDATLVDAALAEGTRKFLRSADAIYAAFTALTGGTLVAWDAELLTRAAAITPVGWLEING